MDTKCGFVALLGRPNVGKSTLLNALVGEKLAGVSRKPQTTRNRLLGVLTEGPQQLIFLDTPGLHQVGGMPRLNETMNRIAASVAADADLVAFMIDVRRGLTDEDARCLQTVLAGSTAQVLVLLSKTDQVKKAEVTRQGKSVHDRLATLFERADWAPYKDRVELPYPMPTSAKRPAEVATLRRRLGELLPEGPWMFTEDDLTDMPESFLCSELIREQVFRQVGEEIPYGCAVTVEKMEDRGDLVAIHATIQVSRKSHKPILVGHGGKRIKSIGEQSRQALERHFEKQVYVGLQVSVVEGWLDDDRLIAQLAHVQGIDEPPAP